jgi:hypothetical protein
MTEHSGKVVPLRRRRAEGPGALHVGGLRLAGMEEMIRAVLPDQGSVEIHRDVHGRRHVHEGDGRGKIVLVLDGGLRLTCQGQAFDLLPGMAAQLIPGVGYSSLALARGATYVVSRGQARVALHG